MESLQTFSNLLVITLVVVFVLALSVMGILLPFFVYRIKNDIMSINDKLSQLIIILLERSHTDEKEQDHTDKKEQEKIIKIKGYHNINILDLETIEHVKTKKIYKGKATYNKKTDEWEIRLH
ncbi:MAG: hypothetical protein JRI69_12035 [Deltaproteobacteria bacterium]|nr:hypothetical protein [Deltaproteobacteria bacterium]MBW2089635.1 hypothetical protein [Deltaproteobacteria bacterium]